ncbi:transcription elongation factor GreA [Atopostipes suicloacalis DSM 15692]|uniref:Transcription elongation factor GreA n=1 Tax=Atopostipes suicloacalis DSM 15692 TaxID=1121025 RepID=A0A1M4U1B4_9LACT|nr:transcription elongation factor GreA [Atopostipes suicloacalis]SHE50581.1 transcription elongation factor GreA [Atopostipes suicloacalis DSM 15692]
MLQKYPMTLEGKKKLEEELNYLKNVRQQEITEEIKRLRKFCDFEEDKCFSESLEQQSLVRERIKDIEEILNNIELVYSNSELHEAIIIGSTVKFMELPNGSQEIYTIVSPVEANPSKNKISVESPIGRGLLGHKESDNVQIETPAGEVNLRILEVS